jgi:hypothetical protein
MNVLDKVRVVIYRFHEKGLEIFLINNKMEEDPEVWKIPHGTEKMYFNEQDDDLFIKLDPVTDEFGNTTEIIGIEGDWHDIPSIRGMIKHDLKRVKSKVKEVLPDSEKGMYFNVKEAFKKVLPHEYAALKELKDILIDRNAVKNI